VKGGSLLALRYTVCVCVVEVISSMIGAARLQEGYVMMEEFVGVLRRSESMMFVRAWTRVIKCLNI
jgi:hypothetical protein